jgi:hypothetical protein
VRDEVHGNRSYVYKYMVNGTVTYKRRCVVYWRYIIASKR